MRFIGGLFLAGMAVVLSILMWKGEIKGVSFSLAGILFALFLYLMKR